MKDIYSSEFVLASASPRRLQLLEQIGIRPRVVPSRVEEVITKTIPSEVVEELSYQKAADVAAGEDKNCVVIGSDTVVSVDGVILGKPADFDGAVDMIKKLQGRSHRVYTGVTVIHGDKAITFSEETKVFVNPMTDEEIIRYVESGDPMDKAGAYGIQGAFAAFISGIEGSYTNVMGLPVGRLYKELKGL